MLQLILPLLLIEVSIGAPPEYIKYACTETGEIQVMNDGIIQYKSLLARETERTCNVNRTISGGGTVKFVINGCDATKPIRVVIMEEDQETSGTNTIFGGKGVAGYELQCSGVPVGGSLTVLQAKIQAGETGFEYKEQHQVSLSLKMEIKEDGTVRTASQPVKVGTPLNVTISGSDHFSFFAKSCLAEGSKSQVKNLIKEGKTIDEPIISDFSALAPALEQGRMETVAVLYAFHFVGSEDITLNCTVFACRRDDPPCEATIPHDSRPKRAVNEDNSTRMDYVQVGIRVVNEYYFPTSSGRALNFLPGHVVLATLMYFLFC